MKKLAASMAVVLGALYFGPNLAHAAILVINLRDPATVGKYNAFIASEWESEILAVGDISSVRGNDWILDDARFGNKVCAKNPPINGGTLVCLELRGLSSEEARGLAAPSFAWNENNEQIIVKKRRFRINWDALPENVRNELLQTGTVSLDYNGWKNYILDKEEAK